MILKEQMEFLEQIDFPTLAQLWGVLNKGLWPAGLPGRPERQIEGGVDWEIQEWIKDRVGEKACLRAWNEHMDDEDFEIFWRSEHENDPEAKEQYEKRLDRIVEDDEQMRG